MLTPSYQNILREVQELTPAEQDLLRQELEAMRQTHPQPARDRIPGLHAGQIWISDDFDDPLPDAYTGWT